eukprot:maker-scaffold339_size202159-snap-gene-0.9 protein:Tk01766 transcript:maker-scaffold339_size202159-snap-gene-0.9-mRNA-1 annotation:"hypothetical protein SINV_09496"
MVECEKPPYAIAGQALFTETSSTVAAYFAMICSIFGIAGNLITIFVLLRTATLRRHSTTPFLISLAISDFIFSAFNLPLLGVRFHHRDWPLGYGACVVFPFFLYTNICVSSLSMMLIAINRFVGIYYPLRMEVWFSRCKSILAIATIWIISFALMSLPLIEVWGQYGFEKSTFSCTLLAKNGKSPMLAFALLFVAVPFIVMGVCYGAILYKVIVTGRAIRNFSKNDPVPQRQSGFAHFSRSREKDLTKTFGIICLGYFVCFIPTSVLMVFDPMPPCYKNPGWHVFGYIVFWCSAIINPVVYILANRHYRKHFWYCIQWCFCQHPEDLETTVISPNFTPASSARSRVRVGDNFSRKKTFQDQVCVVFPLFTNIGVSTLSMMSITLNRLVGIFFPQRLELCFGRCQSIGAILGIWIISFTFMSLPIVDVWGQYGLDGTTLRCTFSTEASHLTLSLIILFVALPFTVMALCYGAILWVVIRRVIRDIATINEPNRPGQSGFVNLSRSHEKDLTTTFGLICGDYLIFRLPASASVVCSLISTSDQSSGWPAMGYIVFWLSTIINPVVYLLANRYYRSKLWYCIQWCFCQHPEDPKAIVISPGVSPDSSARLRSKVHDGFSRRHATSIGSTEDPMEMRSLVAKPPVRGSVYPNVIIKPRGDIQPQTTIHTYENVVLKPTN